MVATVQQHLGSYSGDETMIVSMGRKGISNARSKS